MKYLCLVFGEESAIAKVDDAHCLEYDRAVRESARIPPAEVGSIEVRPIRPIRTSPRRGTN